MDLNIYSRGGTITPGFWRMPSAAYHADPAPQPSLSSSVAKTLLTQSPRHAWYCHPRLNSCYQPDQSRRLDHGTIAHALLIGKGRDFVEILANDFRSKAAKEQRDLARAEGKTPAIAADLAQARAMVQAARQQLGQIQGCEDLFDDAYGEGEVAVCWEEEDVWCRALIDWLPHSRRVFADYKTTIGSANPAGLGRLMAGQSYEVQAAFYELAVSAIEPDLTGRIQAIFVFQELEPPYALSVVTPDESVMDIGRKKVELAIETWRACLARDEWPGYPLQIVPVQYPAWSLSSWLDQEARHELARMDGYDPFSMLRVGAPGGGRLD